jgi:hypothetical protein
MASALRRAAEAAGKSEFEAAAPAPAGIPQSRTGAAAAPARAKEIPSAGFKKSGLEPTASAISVPSTEEIREIKRIEDPSASDGWNSNSAAAATQAPSFSSLDENQASDSGGKKTPQLVVVLLIRPRPPVISAGPKCSPRIPSQRRSPRSGKFGDGDAPAQPAPSES